MPQVFNVLNCCNCGTFQVHPVVKAKKWSCKICGVKQSFVKVFSSGSGGECRQYVQRLNMARVHAGSLDVAIRAWNREQPPDVTQNARTDLPVLVSHVPVMKSAQKWSQYLEDEVEEEDDDGAEEESTLISDHGHIGEKRSGHCLEYSDSHQTLHVSAQISDSIELAETVCRQDLDSADNEASSRFKSVRPQGLTEMTDFEQFLLSESMIDEVPDGEEIAVNVLVARPGTPPTRSTKDELRTDIINAENSSESGYRPNDVNSPSPVDVGRILHGKTRKASEHVDPDIRSKWAKFIQAEIVDDDGSSGDENLA